MLDCLLLSLTLCKAIKDKPVATLGATQAIVLVADGVITRRNIKQDGIELDPVSRAFIGSQPTWARMAPVGIAQTIGGMWLGEKMKTNRHVWVRRFWWAPQTAGIASNGFGFTFSYVHWKRGY